MTTLLIDVAGWVGMALLIGAYALVTAGRILGTSLLFQLMNLVGGALLMVNSGYYGAWPSAALNLVWVVIGTTGLVRAGLRRTTNELREYPRRRSDDERRHPPKAGSRRPGHLPCESETSDGGMLWVARWRRSSC